MKIVFKLLLLLPLVYFVSGTTLAEGTKELQPVSTINATISLNYGNPSASLGHYGAFATPNADDAHKLWVTIGNIGESVHFGFQKNTSGDEINFVIKNALGTVVYPSGGLPIAVPTTGNGYINSYTEAINGPKAINASGYNQLTFVPTAVGDYYFEFSWATTNDTRRLKFYDITVTSASNIEIKGRVWSKNWQLQMGSNSNGFTGTMFPYTNDQITTSINFNGMAPALFTVACNPTGVSNTGNFLIDRKSVTGNFTYPEYKLFLNNPDEILFPTGIIGGVDSVKTVNSCNGQLDIILYVNKTGIADIILQINPLPGVQAEDINLSDSVYSGNSSTITWDGLDGLGNQVASGTSIQIEITYVNGLTHLPMYDVEYSSTTGPNAWKGFIVNLIRPAGAKPKTLWDDSALSGSTNLAGCLDPLGCHAWGGVGNENTINTWWFALSTTLVPLDIIYKRSEFYAHNNSICDGDSILLAGEYRLLPGAYYDSSLNIMNCDSVHQYNLIVNPRPIVDLGADAFICQGETLTLDAGIGAGQTYLWNTGATSSQITVSTTNTYTVTVNNPHNCPISDSKYVYVSPPPPGVLIKHN